MSENEKETPSYEITMSEGTYPFFRIVWRPGEVPRSQVRVGMGEFIEQAITGLSASPPYTFFTPSSTPSITEPHRNLLEALAQLLLSEERASRSHERKTTIDNLTAVLSKIRFMSIALHVDLPQSEGQHTVDRTFLASTDILGFRNLSFVKEESIFPRGLSYYAVKLEVVTTRFGILDFTKCCQVTDANCKSSLLRVTLPPMTTAEMGTLSTLALTKIAEEIFDHRNDRDYYESILKRLFGDFYMTGSLPEMKSVGDGDDEEEDYQPPRKRARLHLND
jgi:hypothetical protein